ncbi:MAG: S41 family peptidase [Bacteroidaceae bacterium]|nr:S41 family peptidase [Bacteroidaceae bacterium]
MNKSSKFIPTIIAVSVIIGILIGTFYANRYSGNRLNIINTTSNKLNDLLYIIDDQYVDKVDISELVEQAMPNILSELDPHSSYISAKDAASANDELKGSFSGIGVQFTIKDDTVHVNNVIKGGPSENVGILPGDRIVSVDDKPFVGKEVTNEETMRRLKGPKGSKVKLGVKRHGEPKPIYFTVVRGDIPVYSVTSTYMLNPELGYIRIKNFGETTYAELLLALADLEYAGFKGLVVDLRGNTGGYLTAVIQMVNEFLPKNKLIVYTEGRKSRREDYRSDGRGAYQSLPIIVLTDEITASAAEIFAGAIQDNDRGVIIGRRTFGKGLVQQPIEFNDGSLIHLTIARYYTPSGRCIQKPYTNGKGKDYEMDILSRYEHGEFFNEDSIRQNGPVYHTGIGRVVYGGGGVMPDYFVAEDTTGYTAYFSQAVSSGLVAQFCFDYCDDNRQVLSQFTEGEDIAKYLKKQNTLEKFVHFADSKGLVRRNLMIIKSKELFERAIYGNIIYTILDQNDYQMYMNQDDPTVLKAIEIYKQGKTKPVLEKKDDAKEEKEEDNRKVAKGSLPNRDARLSTPFYIASAKYLG